MKKLNLKEIVVIAMISVVLGIASMAMDIIYTPLTTALGPIGGALIYGIYMLSAYLPMYIVRKPFAGMAGSVFAGATNLLMGSPYGINIIVAAVLQGLGCEIGGALTKYNKVNFVFLAIGSVLSMLFVTLRDYFVFGFSELGNMIPLILAIRILSSIVLGAGLAKVIGDSLKKTGALNGFEISR